MASRWPRRRASNLTQDLVLPVIVEESDSDVYYTPRSSSTPSNASGSTPVSPGSSDSDETEVREGYRWPLADRMNRWTWAAGRRRYGLLYASHRT